MKNLLNDLSRQEKNRILEMYGVKTKINEGEEDNLKVIYSCFGGKWDGYDTDNIHIDEVSQLLDDLVTATNTFDFSSDWDEAKIVQAFQNINQQEFNNTRPYIKCIMQKLGGTNSNEDPYLLLARKAFTTMGFTDPGDNDNKRLTQAAFGKFGLKTLI